MSYLKPQTPIELGGNYIYPLTTADQVIVGNGNRLNSLFKKTIQETVILKASNWSESAPYTQTITLAESVDDYKVDANVMYTGNENDSALNKAAGCLSYVKKNRKEITFYCLKNKPEIDIPVEITGTCRNTIATVEDGIKLNFDIVAYSSEEEMLADTPAENTIGVITNVEITGYCFSGTEPENMNEGEVWIKTGTSSNGSFEIINGTSLYPVNVKQYIDSIWVDKVAKSWQNGEWVDWKTYLYNKGNEYTSLTGGWLGRNDSTYYSKGTFTKNADHIKLSGAKMQSINTYVANGVDLTNFNTLNVHVLTGSVALGIITRGSLFISANQVAKIIASANNGAKVGTLDISKFSGVYDVTIWASSETASFSATFDEVYLI